MDFTGLSVLARLFWGSFVTENRWVLPLFYVELSVIRVYPNWRVSPGDADR